MDKPTQLNVALEKVLINVGGDRWIATDDTSGGYPYIVTSFWKARMFNSTSEAFGYLQSFQKDYPNAIIYNIHTATLRGNTETLQESAKSQYETELAALNKKYGRS